MKKLIAVLSMALFGLAVTGCELDIDDRAVPADPQAGTELVR